MGVLRVAYVLAFCALLAYALSSYPGAAARYADFWSSGTRVNSLDGRLLKPALLYAVEKEGDELKVSVLRTYAAPEAQSMTVRLRVFNADRSESIYLFGERAPPGRLVSCAVYAPLAVGLRAEIEVDGARVVEERWLGNP
mgnify:CR=1 FL=1